VLFFVERGSYGRQKEISPNGKQNPRRLDAAQVQPVRTHYTIVDADIIDQTGEEKPSGCTHWDLLASDIPPYVPIRFFSHLF
jgi:hypothetical protein